jgi:hypothetical protein
VTDGLRGLRSRSELLHRPGRWNRPSSLGIRHGRAVLANRIAARRVPFIDMASGVHSRRASRPCFGVEGATLAACSALVVSHHLGGFLLRKVRGLVASRCRSWGSSRFRRLRLVRTVREDRTPSRRSPFPRRLSYPSKDLPRLQPHHVTVAVAPLMLARTFRRGCSSRRFQRLVSPGFRCERHLRGFAPQSSP